MNRQAYLYSFKQLPDPLDPSIRLHFGKNVNLAIHEIFKSLVKYISSSKEASARKPMISLRWNYHNESKLTANLFLSLNESHEEQISKIESLSGLDKLPKEYRKEVDIADYYLSGNHILRLKRAHKTWSTLTKGINVRKGTHYFGIPSPLEIHESDPWSFIDFLASASKDPWTLDLCLIPVDHEREPEIYNKTLSTLRDSLDYQSNKIIPCNVSANERRACQSAIENYLNSLVEEPQFQFKLQITSEDSTTCRFVAMHIGHALLGANGFGIEEPSNNDSLSQMEPEDTDTEHHYVMPQSHAEAIFRLPEVGERLPTNISTSLEHAQTSDQVDIADTMGSCLNAMELERHRPIYLTPDIINKHVFVTGASGSGKTSTVHQVLRKLRSDEWKKENNEKIPFLVIEPVKTEYRKLRKHLDDLRVFTPGDPLRSPFCINPLQPHAPDRPAWEHISLLDSLFRAALPMQDILPVLLRRGISDVYKNRGWNLSSSNEFNDNTRNIPDMGELLETVKNRLEDETSYRDDVKNNLMAAFDTRISRLMEPPMQHIFALRETVPSIKELISHPTVVELDHLNEDDANLVTLFLLFAIREYLRKTYDESKPGLRLVLVLEEAHRFLKGDHSPEAAEGAFDPRMEATKFIEKLLAEMRALGLGIIISDQSASGIGSSILRNTRTKIIHQCSEPQDLATMAASMALDAEHTEQIRFMRAGEAFYSSDGYFRPVTIRVAKSESNLDDSTPEPCQYEVPNWLNNVKESIIDQLPDKTKKELNKFMIGNVDIAKLTRSTDNDELANIQKVISMLIDLLKQSNNIYPGSNLVKNMEYNLEYLNRISEETTVN